MSPTIICVVGTRPEAIKMAPVVRALRSAGFHAPVLATAQHRHLLDQVLSVFQLDPTWDLDAMSAGQELSSLFARILPRIDALLAESRPVAVLAQGDTTSVFAVALAAFHARVPFGHVEAGLRSGSLAAPFPEEGNRRLASVLARWHFAPSETAAAALRREGVPTTSIHVVGNPVIDALFTLSERPDLPWPASVPVLASGQRLVLVTLHRRENFGEPLARVLGALRTFARDHPEASLVYPVHPNPSVVGPARQALSDVPNVHLLEPAEYPVLVNLLRRSYLVLTDSGGLQEEAPALGKPVLVFRDVTERPEAVLAGGVRLVGTDPHRFRDAIERLWNDRDAYAAMAQPRFPYGDGHAGEQIARVLLGDLDGSGRRDDPHRSPC